MIDQGLVAARLANYATLLAATGLPLHALAAGQARLNKGMRGALLALAAAGVIASLWWALASVAAMAALPIAALDGETVSAVLKATPLGAVLVLRCAAFMALAILVVSKPLPALAALVALPALLSTAWTGHAGAAEGMAGTLLRGSDSLHLAAAALWLGALVTFLTELRPGRDPADATRGLASFTRTGTAVVTVLLVTGIANSYLIGARDGLPSGPWPRLILVKVALFCAMLGLAASNRWRLVPALENGSPGAVRRMRSSLSLEAGCGLAIVAVVAIAGQLDPHGL